MKVLRLATSAEFHSSAPADQRLPALLRGMLEQATGEKAEIASRVVWPSPELPAILERWLDEDRPDIVFYWVNPFWYAFRSAPLGLERRLGGKLGPLGRGLRRASRKPWLSGSPLGRTARRIALKTVGGAFYFEIDEVIEVLRECLRRTLRREEMVAVVFQGGTASFETLEEAARSGWDEGRRLEMNRRLRELCHELHVLCDAQDSADLPGDPTVLLDPDRHPNAAGHVWMAKSQLAAHLAAWRELRGVEERRQSG
jgi:hypothetical protein